MAPDWFHPVIDIESRPFWDGLKDGKLLLMRCIDCDTTYFYPRAHCPSCWSDKVEWTEASGRGTIYSFSTVHQYPMEPFLSMLPYATIIVALEEGPHIMAHWDFSVPLDQLKCDIPVKVGYRKVDDNLTLPIFSPA